MYMGFDHDHESFPVRYEMARYGTKNSRSHAKNETFTVDKLKCTNNVIAKNIQIILNEHFLGQKQHGTI
jgi:hypothetical protein